MDSRYTAHRDSRYAVVGNLACAPEAGAEERSGSASFTLERGGRPVAAETAQFMPARAHACLSAKRQSASHACAMGLLAALMVLALVGGTGAALSARTAHYEALVSALETCEVTVKSGDSLWSLAEAYPVEELDTAQTVEVLKSLNDLASSTLQPGMVLVVPAPEG